MTTFKSPQICQKHLPYWMFHEHVYLCHESLIGTARSTVSEGNLFPVLSNTDFELSFQESINSAIHLNHAVGQEPKPMLLQYTNT